MKKSDDLIKELGQEFGLEYIKKGASYLFYPNNYNIWLVSNVGCTDSTILILTGLLSFNFKYEITHFSTDTLQVFNIYAIDVIKEKLNNAVHYYRDTLEFLKKKKIEDKKKQIEKDFQ